jgi:hypothetical protein
MQNKNPAADNIDYIINKYNLDINAASPIIIPDLKRDELTKLYAELKFKAGAEIGVLRGTFSQEICESNPGVKLYCVDAWQNYTGIDDDKCQQHRLDRYYNQTKFNLRKHNFEIIRKFSMEAVKDFSPESLDFVYIDGNHKFDYIMEDIIEWSKVVRPGGIVSGHDFTRRDISHTTDFDVIEATGVYTTVHKIKPWFVFGGERSASWFWVKS